MARIVGQKKAREIWFLCRYYSAHEALEMGLINTVVPLAELELVCMYMALFVFAAAVVGDVIVVAGVGVNCCCCC